MRQLERFRGHFYNWYGTDTLRPLEPRYVSTVDSGNLAGLLLAVSNACRDLSQRALLGPAMLTGISDAVRLVEEAARSLRDDRRTLTVTMGHLDQARLALVEAIGDLPPTPADWVPRLRRLATAADTLVDVAQTLTAERGDDDAPEVLVWARAVRATITSHERDVEATMPWALGLQPLLTSLSDAAPEATQALRELTAPSVSLARLHELDRARGGRTEEPGGSSGRREPRGRHREPQALGSRMRSAARAPCRGDGPHQGAVRPDGVRISLRARPGRSSRSAIGSETEASIRADTISWRPRRVWPASSRSRRGTSPWRTGSTSADR